jgi:DNA-damage-inducible protein J
MTTDTTLNVRIDREIKERAAAILEASGLTTSMAVRLFLLKVVEEKMLPFEMARPNLRTRRAIAAARKGRVIKTKSNADLLKKLHERR